MALVVSVNAYSPVNLYQKPDVKSTVVGMLAPGMLVPLIEMANDGLWLKVGLDVVGWVAGSQVSLSGTFYAHPGTAPNRQALIQSDSAFNVRAGPGLTYRILGQIQGGQVVVVNGQSADRQWVKIPFGRGEGWVAVANVIMVGGQSTVTPRVTVELTREP